LRGIRTLLYHEGYTIKGVQKVLRERGIRHVAAIGRIDASSCDDGFVSNANFAGETPVEAFTTLARIRDETVGALDTAHRERLEDLLGELLALKARLHVASRSLAPELGASPAVTGD
jgi:hypothetical protein